MRKRPKHLTNKPKRDRSHKTYKPRHIHLPVMSGLRDEFALVLHSALTAAELGHFSKDQYDRIGQAINTIWGALELRPPKGSAAAKLVIEGAMRAVNEAGKRGDATDVWMLRGTEQAAVLAGIRKAEEILTRLDVFTLNEAIEQINIMKAEDRCKRNVIGIDPGSGKDRSAVVKYVDGQVDQSVWLENISDAHLERIAA